MGVTDQLEQSLTADILHGVPHPRNIPNSQQYYLGLYHNTELALMLSELNFQTRLQNHTVEWTGWTPSARVPNKRFPITGPAICL